MRLQEFVQRDIISQLLESENGEWILVEAKHDSKSKSKSKNSKAEPNLPAVVGVQFVKGKLFDSTVAERKQMMSGVDAKIEEFMATKTADPLQPFGGKDKPFGGDGPIGRAFPKMRYASLNSDLRLFYSIEGRNPTIIKMFGVFSHDDIGLGQPNNINRQASFIKRLRPEVNNL